MTTIRDERLWKDHAIDGINVVLGKLGQNRVDRLSVLNQTRELEDQLSYYDLYRGSGESGNPDSLDHTMGHLGSLRRLLVEGDLFRAKYHAQSLLESLKANEN